MTPLEQTHRRDSAQNPRQLRDGRDIGLTEKNSARRIKSACQEIHSEFPHICPKRSGIMDGRERVEIRDEVVGLALFPEARSRASSFQNSFPNGESPKAGCRKECAYRLNTISTGLENPSFLKRI
jgi:hypothetical protein